MPIGGETNDTESTGIAKASYNNTIKETKRLHYTFVNQGYAGIMTKEWRDNGTYDSLRVHLGYRFQLVSGTYGSEAAPGGKLQINMQIKNTGFAPLYNARDAYIVLKNSSKTYQVKLAADPRTWLPNEVVSTVNEQITLPSNMTAGTYQLYLWLPDKYASLAENPKYAVRFANKNVWDSESGMNNLNASVTVSSSANPDPDPTPGTAVVLPATLNKANVARYSDDMTWYKTEYFDFGSTDAENLNRWAEWDVELKYPGTYKVSESVTASDAPDAPTGHEWNISLLNGGTTVSSYNTTRTWDVGEIPASENPAWDLSGVQTGVYILRVKNAFDWAQPKLKSLTLEFDGEIPSALETVEWDMNAPMYDVLGRQVGAGYKGIVIQAGKKRILR